MNLNRINTVVLHSWYHLTHSLEVAIDLFWYPTVQFVIFGLIAYFFAQWSHQQAFIILVGAIFWDLINVGSYTITVGALWEIWSKSFGSMFITPLTLEEFVVGQMISGLTKSILVFFLLSFISLFFYHFSVFQLGIVLPIYFIELLVFSWAAGMFILGLIFRFGTDVQSLSWSLINIVQPFSAAYYPITVLPESIRWISYFFPTVYIFETIREQLNTGTINWSALGIATVFNVLYFLGGYLFIRQMFIWSKETGTFARMEQ